MDDPGFDALRRRLVTAAAAALALPAAAQPASKQLRVGVEASLQASGLASRLAQAIGRDTGLGIEWRAGPSGLLLPQLERGELDAALTCAPELELSLQRQNLIHDRRPVARVGYVLIGPAPRKATRKTPAGGDPAGVAGGRDVARALSLIAVAGARGAASFVVSGEPSGARALEQSAWLAAGPQPLGPWLRTAAPGPQGVLALAREMQAYALVERGVWLAAGTGSGLAVLVEDEARLTVSYHVMRPFRVNHPGGKLLVAWLAGPNGQGTVADFGRGYRPAA
jgi:tungstate transport system substrate-binding protein